MSIKKVIQIKRLGIYDDYKWGCSKEFGKYNLIFGFNGSGKSTLTNLLNLVASKSNYSDEKKSDLFSDLKKDESSEVSFFCTNNATVSYPPSQNQNNKNIFVFNSNFISDHVYDGTIGKLQKFNAKQTTLEDPEIKNLNTQIQFKNIAKEELEKELAAIRAIFEEKKKHYNALFRDLYPSKLLRFGSDIPPAKPTEKPTELSISLKAKTAELKLIEKQGELLADISILEGLTLQTIFLDIAGLEGFLKSTVKQTVALKLKANIQKFQEVVEEQHRKQVEPWYKFAQALLSINRDSDTSCPLCNTDISSTIDDLVEDFDRYFNLSYEDFISNLNKQIALLVNLEKGIITNVNGACKTISDKGQKYNSLLKIDCPSYSFDFVLLELKKLTNRFREKTGNTSKPLEHDFNKLSLMLSAYNSYIESLEKYRKKAISVLKERKIDPAKVEKEIRDIYTKLAYISFDGLKGEGRCTTYYGSWDALAQLELEINQLTNDKIKRLRNLKTEAKKVGEYLSKLGISHFTIDLQEDKDENNILIKYAGDTKVKKRLKNTLSEGEKTALAFSYFLSKVSTEAKEKGKTIVVIDDPISSLDDNRLYNTAYLIHSEFSNYEQLFILSHNLLFLKYVNPMFHADKATFMVTQGSIFDLPESLQNFQSPYFYMVESVLSFIHESTPNYDIARQFLPNYVRRVLETFLSFKYAKLGKKRSNFSPGLEDFIKDSIEFDAIPMRKVGNIDNTNLKAKLSNINRICDNHSHGNMQLLDECNFISDERLKELATDTIDIINFFDGIHGENIQKLIPEVVLETVNT